MRSAYHSVVPLAIRRQLWKARRRIPRRLHDLRWQITPTEALGRWTDERLELGPWFWLFIVGCNNSGTTLLVEILQSHELIRSLPKEGNASPPRYQIRRRSASATCSPSVSTGSDGPRQTTAIACPGCDTIGHTFPTVTPEQRQLVARVAGRELDAGGYSAPPGDHRDHPITDT